MSETTTIERLLEKAQRGDRDALDELFTRLYDVLKWLAHRQRGRWRGNYTLNTTALVHEAYVKLVGQAQLAAKSRDHFRALASRAMRHILCDYARDQCAQKRGGPLAELSLHELDGSLGGKVSPEEQWIALVTLDDALRRLEQIDRRQSEIVECRFFGGLTIDETAAAVGVSARTVKRDWAMAQAWLHRELSAGT